MDSAQQIPHAGSHPKIEGDLDGLVRLAERFFQLSGIVRMYP